MDPGAPRALTWHRWIFLAFSWSWHRWKWKELRIIGVVQWHRFHHCTQYCHVNCTRHCLMLILSSQWSRCPPTLLDARVFPFSPEFTLWMPLLQCCTHASRKSFGGKSPFTGDFFHFFNKIYDFPCLRICLETILYDHWRKIVRSWTVFFISICLNWREMKDDTEQGHCCHFPWLRTHVCELLFFHVGLFLWLLSSLNWPLFAQELQICLRLVYQKLNQVGILQFTSGCEAHAQNKCDHNVKIRRGSFSTWLWPSRE